MVRKRGAGLVGYVVECLDFVCTIVIARALVVWWWMKITPDKDLNYRKKNLQFNLSTIPIGIADLLSVVNGFGGTFWRELCTSKLVLARSRYRRTTRKRIHIVSRLFLNNLKRREYPYFTPNGVHSQCALSIPMYLGTLNWASWNWNILPRSKTLPMPKANNSTNNFRQICDMGPNRFHPSNGSGRFRITKPSKPRAGNNNIIKYHTYLSLSG